MLNIIHGTFLSLVLILLWSKLKNYLESFSKEFYFLGEKKEKYSEHNNKDTNEDEVFSEVLVEDQYVRVKGYGLGVTPTRLGG